MRFLGFLIALSFFTISCSTPKVKQTNNSNLQMEFIITKTQSLKDKQFLFLNDINGTKFTTIISPADGNWVDVVVGDHISLEAKEIMKTRPVHIVSNNIKILTNKPDLSGKYEKMEEDIFWIHSHKKEVYDTSKQPVLCLQYQQGNHIKQDTEWEVFCDKIEYFKYIEGHFYQVKVLKKWLKNHENLIDKMPYDLQLRSVLSKEKDTSYINPIKTIISTEKHTYKLNEAINLSFSVENTGKENYSFLSWGTPIKKLLLNNCLTVKHEEKTIPYSVVVMKREFTAKDSLTLEINEKVSGNVNLLEWFQLHKKGEYTIQFKGTYQGLPPSNTIVISIE